MVHIREANIIGSPVNVGIKYYVEFYLALDAVMLSRMQLCTAQRKLPRGGKCVSVLSMLSARSFRTGLSCESRSISRKDRVSFASFSRFETAAIRNTCRKTTTYCD